MSTRLDVALLVAFQPKEAGLLDPTLRGNIGVFYAAPIVRALTAASNYLGESVFGYTPELEGGYKMPREAHRSLSAVALATVLDRAGLNWKVLDPPAKSIAWWREELSRLAASDPAVVGISSTFITAGPWLEMLCSIVREQIPRAKLVVGGYFYGSETQTFLGLDADVLYVGEGEERFPQLVRAVRAGEDLHHIPGLYLRRADGRLDFTGQAEPLDLSKHCRPDWTLAARIDPPVDIQRDYIDAGVETQRGCVFKCEFCTYRTLSAPNLMSSEVAVDRILDLSVVKRGAISLHDATGTFPHERWRAILERLAARGGAPNPIRAFARVSDIDEVTAALMARANVRQLFIGQESGDQRILDLMRKGTKLSQFAPAMRALARHRITVTLGFISGFPGETEESAANTRRLLGDCNSDCPDNPVALVARMGPFVIQDFASVATRRNEFRERGPEFGSRGFDAEGSSREALRTMIELSKIPHAPAYGLWMDPRCQTTRMFSGPHRLEIFRAMKLIDRVISIFLDQDVFGTVGDRSELANLRTQLHRGRRRPSTLARARLRAATAVGGKVLNVLWDEWRGEMNGTVGPLTKLIVGVQALRDTRNLRRSLASHRAGTYSAQNELTSAEVVETARHADALISTATLKARTAKLPRTA